MQTTSLDVEVARLRFELKAARSEISKLHKQMNQLQKTVRRELAATRRAALDAVAASAAAAGTQPAAAAPSMPAAPKAGGGMCMVPVGHIESCFLTRNGTPRQPGLAQVTTQVEVHGVRADGPHKRWFQSRVQTRDAAGIQNLGSLLKYRWLFPAGDLPLPLPLN